MTWIPSASSNRSWNIRKSCFLPSCPHQVCEYYVLGYWSTATIEVCVIWLTTKLKRRRGAVWTPKKRQLSYEIANGALMALLETLRCSHGDTTSFLLRVYQYAEPRCVLCAFSKCAPSHGILQSSSRFHREDEDAVPFLERWRKLYCKFLVV